MKTKEDMERMFRNAGLKPVHREAHENHNIFIGDGFSLPPHKAFRRFGIDEDEFPRGMYVTWWWIGKDENLAIGRPLFFNISEKDSWERIQAARFDAKNNGMAKLMMRKAHAH